MVSQTKSIHSLSTIQTTFWKLLVTVLVVHLSTGADEHRTVQLLSNLERVHMEYL